MDTKPYGGWTKILAILCSRARTFKNVSVMIFFSSQFERSAGFLHSFARILVHPLEAWLAQVDRSNLPELQSFAAGIEKDKDTVRAGLTWWINNGMVEGHVTKLKLIKRQGYGRAGFPLLRKRVLHAF